MKTKFRRCNNHTTKEFNISLANVAENDFKSLLHADDIKRKKLIDLNNIYQLFAHATNDIVNNFIAKMTEGLARDQHGNYVFPKMKHTVKQTRIICVEDNISL